MPHAINFDVLLCNQITFYFQGIYMKGRMQEFKNDGLTHICIFIYVIQDHRYGNRVTGDL